MHYSEEEIEQYAALIREQIEMDEKDVREAQEAIEAKTELSISQKIAELIERIWGFFSQEIFERVWNILHRS